MSRSKRVRTLKPRREKERERKRKEEGGGKAGCTKRLPSFVQVSLSLSLTFPLLYDPLTFQRRELLKRSAREKLQDGINLVTRDRISRSIIPPSSYLFIKPLLTIRTRAVRFEISDCIETDVSHLAEYHTPVSNHFL